MFLLEHMTFVEENKLSLRLIHFVEAETVSSVEQSSDKIKSGFESKYPPPCRDLVFYTFQAFNYILTLIVGYYCKSEISHNCLLLKFCYSIVYKTSHNILYFFKSFINDGYH